MLAKEIWEKDKIRERNIIDNLKCNFFIIWERDWRYNKVSVINKIKEIYLNRGELNENN